MYSTPTILIVAVALAASLHYLYQPLFAPRDWWKARNNRFREAFEKQDLIPCAGLNYVYAAAAGHFLVLEFHPLNSWPARLWLVREYDSCTVSAPLTRDYAFVPAKWSAELIANHVTYYLGKEAQEVDDHFAFADEHQQLIRDASPFRDRYRVDG